MSPGLHKPLYGVAFLFHYFFSIMQFHGFRTSGQKGWALVTSSLPVLCCICLAIVPESLGQDMGETENTHWEFTPFSWGHSHRSKSKLPFSLSFRCLQPSAWLLPLDCPAVGMLEWRKGRKMWDYPGVRMLEWRKGRKTTGEDEFSPHPCWSLN